MYYTKEQIGNNLLLGIRLVLGTMWLLAPLLVLSSNLQAYFKADSTSMWAFGAVFGFLFVPMIKPIAEKIVIFCFEMGIIGIK